MFDLKPISSAGVSAALAKADRYRLINDPSSAESIWAVWRRSVLSWKLHWIATPNPGWLGTS